jgi:imidazole glycerol phosphate synthase subunit HisF
MQTSIKIGDKVKFKKQYQDKGDDLIEFVVVESSNDCNRVTVEAQIGFRINPTYRVTVDMLDF